jgi:hypothetical protein
MHTFKIKLGFDAFQKIYAAASSFEHLA